MSPSSFVLRIVSVAAFASIACARDRPREPPAKPSSSPPAAQKAPAAPPKENPVDTLAKLGPVIPEETGHQQPPPPPKELKIAGKIGDVLEGDVSHFKLLSIKPCGDGKTPAPATQDPKARAVYAAEVEIVAKTRLNVSPRDLTLAKGGITFMSSVDLKREVKGCTPLLKVSRLAPKETAKGYVLFDLPAWGPGSKVEELNLMYHPARFGGAIALTVKLADG